MTGRLERHERIAKLRSKPLAISDDEVQSTLAELDASALVPELSALVDHNAGRPRHLSVRALLLGMCLSSARHSGTVTLCTVADILGFRLNDTVREQLGIRRYPDTDQGFEAFYAVVRRLFHRIIHAIDPSPLPKNHRLERARAAELESRADTGLLAHKRSLILRTANLILSMSLRHAHDLLEGFWDGSCVVDATVIGTYSKGLAPDSPVTATDPDAGWYARNSRHKDPLALDGMAPPPKPSKKTGKSAKKATAKARLKKKLFGFDASLIVARDPKHDGAPLPDGSADPAGRLKSRSKHSGTWTRVTPAATSPATASTATRSRKTSSSPSGPWATSPCTTTPRTSSGRAPTSAAPNSSKATGTAPPCPPRSSRPPATWPPDASTRRRGSRVSALARISSSCRKRAPTPKGTAG